MKRFIHIVALLLSLLACSSCLFENDMSYPRLQGRITAFAVEGQKSVTINDEAQTVEVLLQETAEIADLKVLEFVCKPMRSRNLRSLLQIRRK